MHSQQLAVQTQTVIVKVDGTNNGATAGTSALTSSAIDTANADGVRLVYLLGAVTATGTGSLQLQQSDASGSGYANVGSPVTYTDADTLKALVLDVYKPTKRYLRIVNTRATANSVITSCEAQLYGIRVQPRALDATIASRTVFISPA